VGSTCSFEKPQVVVLISSSSLVLITFPFIEIQTPLTDFFFLANEGFVFGEPKRLKMIKVQINLDYEVLVNDENTYLLNTHEWHVKKWKSKSYLRITLHKPQKYDLYIHHFVMKDVREGCSYYFLGRNTLNLQKENIMACFTALKATFAIFHLQIKPQNIEAFIFRVESSLLKYVSTGKTTLKYIPRRTRSSNNLWFKNHKTLQRTWSHEHYVQSV